MNAFEGDHHFPPQSTAVIGWFERRSIIKSGRDEELREETVDITWVRESAAHFGLYFKDRLVTGLRELTDHHGFLTSVRGNDALIESILGHWEIEPTSELELRVTAWLTDTPTLGLLGGDRSLRDRNLYIPMSSLQARPAMYRDNAVDLQANWRGGKVVVPVTHSAAVVYASGVSAAENDRALREFSERASEPARSVGPEIPGYLKR